MRAQRRPRGAVGGLDVRPAADPAAHPPVLTFVPRDEAVEHRRPLAGDPAGAAAVEWARPPGRAPHPARPARPCALDRRRLEVGGVLLRRRELLRRRARRRRDRSGPRAPRPPRSAASGDQDRRGRGALARHQRGVEVRHEPPVVAHRRPRTRRARRPCRPRPRAAGCGGPWRARPARCATRPCACGSPRRRPSAARVAIAAVESAVARTVEQSRDDRQARSYR